MTLNTYAYVGANPTNTIDPSGRSGCPIGALIPSCPGLDWFGEDSDLNPMNGEGSVGCVVGQFNPFSPGGYGVLVEGGLHSIGIGGLGLSTGFAIGGGIAVGTGIGIAVLAGGAGGFLLYIGVTEISDACS